MWRATEPQLSLPQMVDPREMASPTMPVCIDKDNNLRHIVNSFCIFNIIVIPSVLVVHKITFINVSVYTILLQTLVCLSGIIMLQSLWPFHFKGDWSHSQSLTCFSFRSSCAKFFTSSVHDIIPAVPYHRGYNRLWPMPMWQTQCQMLWLVTYFLRCQLLCTSTTKNTH